MQAKQRGKLPAGMERIVTAIEKPGCHDLLAALREFVARAAREDYAWRRPNPRHLARGLYLPTLHSESLPPIAAAIDTSGSVDSALLDRFAAALQVVLDDARPARLRVLACDAAITADREFLPGEVVAGNYPGGGGTDFRPVFHRLDEAEESPCCVVYLTDLDGAFPAQSPDCPVLWVVPDPQTARRSAPFGETIWLDS